MAEPTITEIEAAVAPRATPAGAQGRPAIDVRSAAVYAILTLLVFHTLRLAASLLIPIVFALLASFALSPLVRGLARLRVPRPAGAALVVLLSLAGFLGIVALVAGPAVDWVDRAPGALREVERRIAPVRQPIEEVAVATDQVEKLTSMTPKREPPVEVRSSQSLVELVFSGARDLLASALVVLVLLYFLLASGDAFLTKLLSAIPRFRARHQANEFVWGIEHDVSHYLLLVTAINVALGGVVALAMLLLGMPNPILWGALATVANFVPFLGAMFGTVVVGLAAILSFDGLERALAVPLAYAFLTGVEGLVITPSLLGSRLTLSPVLVFVSLLVWSWLWGVPGALVAVPLLAVAKLVADRFEGLRPLGRVLGGP